MIDSKTPAAAPRSSAPADARRVSISVVIPNFNHARYLPGALDSVLAQSSAPLEVIVIDDASTDDSIAVIDRYAARHASVRAVRNPKNRGVAKNINAILPELAGTHGLFLAADDKALPGYFAAAVALLEKFPQAGMGLADFQVFWNDGRELTRRHVRGPRDARYVSPVEVPSALYNSWPHGQSIVRVAALREVGGYREDLRWHCDWFASWAICARHGFCYAPVVGTALRVSDDSYSGAGRRGARQREVLEGLVALVTASENAWLRPALIKANAFSHFGPPIVPVLRRSAIGREWVTRQLIWAITSGVLVGLAGRLMPRALKDWVKRCLLKR